LGGASGRLDEIGGVLLETHIANEVGVFLGVGVREGVVLHLHILFDGDDV
jgi:hypothetical protein